MVFDEKSSLVKIWVEKVNDQGSGVTIDDVPKLFNLKNVVLSLLNEEWFFMFKLIKIMRRLFIMTFTKDSALVKIWFSAVLGGVYTRAQIPNLFNLQEVVNELLDEIGFPK